MLLNKFDLKNLNFKGRRKKTVDPEEVSLVALYEAIEIARKAWMDAKSNFDQATEKDCIDALIHKIDAYEREYIYLLKIARKEDLNVLPEVKSL